MVSWSLLSAAAAVLCWPSAPAAVRLRALFRLGRRYRLNAKATRAGLTATTGVLAVGLLGPWGALGIALLAAAVLRHRRARRRIRCRLTETAATAEGLRTMVTELRAGADTATAAQVAAADAPAAVAERMRVIAATARLGGDLAPVAADRTFGEEGARWQIAHRAGLPLADLLDARRRDLESTAGFIATLDARMAGPRTSALVLAVLPGVGLALGQAAGAATLRVLVATGPGQALLLAGAVLITVGLAWVNRLTSAAVRP